MLLAEIVNSCSHDQVAKAAVLSIGAEFVDRVCASAAKYGLDPGLFAAMVVQRFATAANNRDWDALHQAMSGTDQPILVGFRHILEPALADDSVELHPAWRGPTMQFSRTRPLVAPDCIR
jgi:hypothetical protein